MAKRKYCDTVSGDGLVQNILCLYNCVCVYIGVLVVLLGPSRIETIHNGFYRDQIMGYFTNTNRWRI